MKLRTKLIIALIFILSVLAPVRFIIVTLLDNTSAAFDEIVNALAPVVSSIESMESAAAGMSGEVFSLTALYGIAPNVESDDLEEDLAEEVEEFEEFWADFQSALDSFAALSVQQQYEYPGISSPVETLRSSSAAFYAAGRDLIDLAQAGGSEQDIYEAIEAVEAAEGELYGFLDTMFTAGQTELLEVSRAANTIIQQQQTFTSLSGVALSMVIVVSMVMVYRTVAAPVARLDRAARSLSAGDYTQRVAVRSKDEIGALAKTFNSMADAVQKRDAELSSLNSALERGLADAQAARDEAERASQVKSAFLASMSHELRTPLNAVINFTRFVAKGVMGPVNEQQKEALGKVNDSARHLLNLINDVLDMSKIESGSLNLFVEDTVNVNEIIDEATGSARALLIDKPVTLDVQAEAALPTIIGDRQRLLQVLLNLLSNACKFTDEGTVTLRAQQENGNILFAVADTGPGIAAEDHALVFEAFKQTHSGLQKGGGTGLGLPISKSLVEAHGGRLWFESAPGNGTTFFVSLPVQSSVLTPVTN